MMTIPVGGAGGVDSRKEMHRNRQNIGMREKSLINADDLRAKAQIKSRFWEQAVAEEEHVPLDQILVEARNEILEGKQRSRQNMGMREKERQRREKERQEQGKQDVEEIMKKQAARAGLRTLQQFLSEATQVQSKEDERYKALKLAKSLNFAKFGSMRAFCGALHRANLNLQSQQVSHSLMCV